MSPARKTNTDVQGTTQKKKPQLRNEVRKRSEQPKNDTKFQRKIRSMAWIVPDLVDEQQKKCTACNIRANARQSVRSHMKSMDHESNVVSKLSEAAEFQISAYLVENGLPLEIAEGFVSLCKKLFFDSRICQGVNLNTDKVISTINKDIAPKMISELASKLRTRKFSIHADELKDISSARTFCIMVQYFDDYDGRIKISYWNLSSTENGNIVNQRAAEYLYMNIKASFIKFNIPDYNIVGFGSDGGNDIMYGKLDEKDVATSEATSEDRASLRKKKNYGKDSVANKFNDDYSGIEISGFTHDSIYLCISEACKVLPEHCERLPRNALFHLQTRAKKSALTPFKKLLDLELREMLYQSETCSLSLIAVVNCMLELWPALTCYFNSISTPETIGSEGLVLVWLEDPFIKLYYHFLQWVLPLFNKLNVHFQSSKVVITELKANFEKFYKAILKFFLNNEYVDQTELQNIDPAERKNHLSDTEMLLEPGVRSEIERIAVAERVTRSPDINDDLEAILGGEPPNLASLVAEGTSPNISSKSKEFFDKIRGFYVAAAVGIKKRCNFGDLAIALIAALHPDVARDSRLRPRSILPLATALPRISSDDADWKRKIDYQWRVLPIMYIPEDIEPDVFWRKIRDWKNDAGEKTLSILGQFALDALISPHPNADYGRISRKINLLRTRTNNEFDSDCGTIYHAMLLSDDMKCNGNDRVGFLPSNKTTNSISKTLNRKPDAIASTSRN